MYSSSSGINTLNAEYEIIEYAMITYLLFDMMLDFFTDGEIKLTYGRQTHF
jgi:hypothetical protein